MFAEALDGHGASVPRSTTAWSVRVVRLYRAEDINLQERAHKTLAWSCTCRCGEPVMSAAAEHWPCGLWRRRSLTGWRMAIGPPRPKDLSPRRPADGDAEHEADGRHAREHRRGRARQEARGLQKAVQGRLAREAAVGSGGALGRVLARRVVEHVPQARAHGLRVQGRVAPAVEVALRDGARPAVNLAELPGRSRPRPAPDHGRGRGQEAGVLLEHEHAPLLLHAPDGGEVLAHHLVVRVAEDDGSRLGEDVHRGLEGAPGVHVRLQGHEGRHGADAVEARRGDHLARLR
mmetsp:Transcript_17662/g.59193  ORF Transcript_17662/g.59193 Transcript_17662/m.59193 type:complete len:290 (+) Transcript_17662:173-1042(+)